MQIVTKDVFEGLPKVADAIVMKYFLSSGKDEDARTQKEYKRLFKATGFQLEKVVHTGTNLSALEFGLRS